MGKTAVPVYTAGVSRERDSAGVRMSEAVRVGPGARMGGVWVEWSGEDGEGGGVSE